MLSVNGITKRYGERMGVRNIQFSCGSGEIISVIGPNGSGKSTLLRIIAGTLKGDAGSVLLDGHDAKETDVKRATGYMPDSMELARGLTVRNFFHMISDYKYGGKYKEEFEKAMKEFGLSSCEHTAFDRLSMGNQKKVSMIAALTGNPRLVILDEPTNGVDTSGILVLKQYIRETKKRGSIVLVSSHMLDFAESIADTAVFLKNGEIAATEKNRGQWENVYRRLYL